MRVRSVRPLLSHQSYTTCQHLHFVLFPHVLQILRASDPRDLNPWTCTRGLQASVGTSLATLRCCTGCKVCTPPAPGTQADLRVRASVRQSTDCRLSVFITAVATEATWPMTQLCSCLHTDFIIMQGKSCFPFLKLAM